MRSKWIVKASVLVALVLAGVLVQAALAGKFHFLNTGISLGSLVFNGDLVGLGNEVAEVTLTGYGTVTVMCENKGGQQAPGRNPISMNVQQKNDFRTDENGFAVVEVTTKDPTLSQLKPSPTSKQAGCPNTNWKVVDTVDGSTNWTAAKVVVKDEDGLVQVNLSYTCTTFFTGVVSTGIKCDEN